MPEQNTSGQDDQNEDQDPPSKGIGCGTTEGHCMDPNRHGLM
ncbi:hypothetical protein [Streptomyces chrestomyceticus]